MQWTIFEGFLKFENTVEKMLCYVKYGNFGQLSHSVLVTTVIFSVLIGDWPLPVFIKMWLFIFLFSFVVVDEVFGKK